MNIQELFKKTLSLATAITSGEKISDERIAKRLAICSTCDKLIQKDGCMACSICGCKLKGNRSLTNLALYNETEKYGCKYEGGSKWKAAGVMLLFSFLLF